MSSVRAFAGGLVLAIWLPGQVTPSRWALDRVLETGEPLEVSRHGRRIRIAAVPPEGKLARLARRPQAIAGDPGDLVHQDWSSEWRP